MLIAKQSVGKIIVNLLLFCIYFNLYRVCYIFDVNCFSCYVCTS